jgi:Tol biopolymer transport system component
MALSEDARAGDPERDHYTIETAHFVIHYWKPLDDVARRVAVVAEHAHRTLVPALDHRPKTKTLIVLVDDTDSANGFAGVLPRNAIQLFATAPGAFSELDDHDDWLYGLVAHEYTHILHLDTMSGLPNIYNRIFGKSWAPNQVMPRWIIEGVAVYEESKRSSGGRNRGTRFDQFIRIARHVDKDLRLDQVSGAPRQFPRGNAIYVYGSHFLRYVFDRFGDDTLRAMSHTSGGHPTPYAINRQIAKVTGKPFTELYGDWKGYLRDRYGMQEMAAERRGLHAGRQLTRTGENNFHAVYSADGKRIVWQQFDGYNESHIRSLPVGGDSSQATNVVQIDGIGPFDLAPDGSLVFEQGRAFRRVYSFQDLFRWDARTGEQIRLTLGRRGRDPVLSPDGRKIAYSQNGHSQSVLAVMDAVPDAPPTIVWKGDGRYDQVYTPAWSPDGKRLAFSAWRAVGKRDILVVDLASGRVEEITNDRAIEMSPMFSRDGRWLYFDSDRTGIANIYAYDLERRELWQVTNVLGGAFRPAISPDGKRLAYENAVPKGGYDLFEVEIDRTTWLPARDYVDDKPPPRLIRDDETAISKPRKYRALETLAPNSWSAQLALTEAEPSISVLTDGADAFGLHSYQLALGTNLETGDLNIGAVYGYNRLRPNLRFAVARTLAERGGFRIDGVPAAYKQEDWSATFSSSIPFEARPDSSWSLSFDYDVDWFRLVGEPRLLPEDPDPNMRLPVVPITDYLQAGLGARVGYSSVRGVTYGVGPQWGVDYSVGLRLDHPALGATYSNITVSYATSTFHRLWGKTPVVSARLAGSFRAGDLVRAGGFSLGGVPPQDVVRSIIDSARFGSTGYLRGYPNRTVVGNQFHLLNLEYRQELLQIERGIATLPIYFRRITIAGLADAGTAFDTEFDADRHLKNSLGGALRFDAFFGYFVPGTFEIGYSRGLADGGIDEFWFLLTGSL